VRFDSASASGVHGDGDTRGGSRWQQLTCDYTGCTVGAVHMGSAGFALTLALLKGHAVMSDAARLWGWCAAARTSFGSSDGTAWRGG
jgi:hypothetical protein